MSRQTLKQALLAILIGAATAFVTSLLNGLLDLLQANVADLSGAGASMVYFLKSWKTSPAV